MYEISLESLFDAYFDTNRNTKDMVLFSLRIDEEIVRLIAEPGGASWLFPEPALYVEGFVYSNGLFPIEHAFVKIGDRYIDPTFERALKRDPRQEMYVSLIEIAPRELLKLEGETGHYGEMYRYSYLKRFRPDLAARMRDLNPNGK